MAHGAPVVNVYIDGYNFYCSISRPDNKDLALGWCNFFKLSEKLAAKVFPGHKLGAVKYYTAGVPPDLQTRTGERDRQALWLEALRIGTADQVKIVKGYWQKDKKQRRVEKQTDIRLAISMLRDALIPRSDPRFSRTVHDERDPVAPCDATILISADKDFLPVVEMVSQYGKDVAVFMTYNQAKWGGTGIDRLYFLTKEDLEEAKLLDPILRPDGSAITWRDYLEKRKTSVQRRDSPPYRRDAAADSSWLRQCGELSKQSADPDTKVGCVIVGPDGLVRSEACNEVPEGILPPFLGKPEKYDWLEHAERNAIYAAAKEGRRLQGCTMYVDLLPCVECARAIVQSGILEVVVSQQRCEEYPGGKYTEKIETAKAILRGAGITLRLA